MEPDLPLAGHILRTIKHVDLSVSDDGSGIERSELLPPDDAVTHGRGERGGPIWRDDRIDLSRLFKRAEHPVWSLRFHGCGRHSEKDETGESQAIAHPLKCAPSGRGPLGWRHRLVAWSGWRPSFPLCITLNCGFPAAFLMSADPA